jgi:hypothetical protein
LALEIRRSAGSPRRRLEIPQHPRQHLPVRRDARSHGGANLKERHRVVHDRLIAQWSEWNATMMSPDPQSFTLGFTGAELADHYGVKAGA